MRRFFVCLWFIPLAVALGALGCPADTGLIEISGGVSVEIGSTLQLTATTVDATDDSYTWASGDTSVLTIDASGLVSGIGLGQTTITVTGVDSGLTARTGFVVLPLPPSPTVSVTADTYSMMVGGTLMVTATTTNGVDSGYGFLSNDTAVATVDAAGLVTAVMPGEFVITATGDDTGAIGILGLVVEDPGIQEGEVPFYVAWLGSGHADSAAEAFRHWDEDDPAEIPVECAKCHSSAGYRDFLGDDGSAAGTVDAAVPVGEVITCNACHSGTAQLMTSVTFPSGLTVDHLGDQARCQVCHQGSHAKATVDAAIDPALPPDTVDPTFAFLNIHYFAAGAVRNGLFAEGGYQYPGKTYDGVFQHVTGYDTCIGCHDPHRTELRLTECQACHAGLASAADVQNIRMPGTAAVDFDGDLNFAEGLAGEIQGLESLLLTQIQAYANADAGRDAICYSSSAYPYFFIDTDADGSCGAAEAIYPNKYATWTPRMLRAAYNYQFSHKDPGGYAHNGRYLTELLFDSIEDLEVTAVVGLARQGIGHFDGAAEAFRHWDGDGELEYDCASCHGGVEGLRAFLETGVGKTVELSKANGLQCETCHTDFTAWGRITVPEVKLPGGVIIADFGNDNTLCATCHAGRESTVTIDAEIAAGDLGFKNIHYLPAAASIFGSEGRVGYEYAGMIYAGRKTHVGGAACLDCHKADAADYTFHVSSNFTDCTGCHAGAVVPGDIRMVTMDFDGDGNIVEPLADEVHALADALLVQIQTVATTNGNPVCYTSGAYPYFFIDTDANGMCNGAEGIYPNRYQSWTAPMLRAAHNFQFSQKEHGAWAHNIDYMVQLLIDANADLGGDVSSFSRP